MTPPIAVLLYPRQRDVYLYKINTDYSSSNCTRLWEQYNKCIVTYPHNCKELHANIVFHHKCPIQEL